MGKSPAYATRPNKNPQDACCRCGVILNTPADLAVSSATELVIYQPSPSAMAQWMCHKCADELEAE
jgi:hypothetical protein